MNPLFAAHLIADFLLQPTWLVALKQKRLIGILIHSVVHFVVMAVFLAPFSIRSLAVITIVAGLHGLIDYAKIRIRRTVPFWRAFLLDQMAHLVVIALASLVVTAPAAMWQTQSGYGQIVLLIFFSFSMAWFNMSRIPSMKKSLVALFVNLAIAFLLFIVPGAALASSPCSLP